MATIKTGTWKDARDAWEQVGIGEPPPSGLVPLGDTGLYTTPDTPADPQDCNRYPSSPWCGGNPINSKPFEVEVSTTIQANPCGVTRSITAEVTVGFIKFPPVSAAHIPENCREEYENQGAQKIPDPPPDDLEGYNPTPQYRPQGISLNSKVIVVTIDQFSQTERIYAARLGDWATSRFDSFGSLDEIKTPIGAPTPNYEFPHTVKPAFVSLTGVISGGSSINDIYKIFYGFTPDYEPNSGSAQVELRLPKDYPTEAELFSRPNGNYQAIWHYVLAAAYIHPIAVYVGRFGDIFPNPQISPLEVSSSVSPTKDFYRTTIHTRNIAYIKVLSGDSSDRRPPPPPPPKKHCCEDDMGCCQPPYNNQQQQDQASILALLRKIDKKLGEFPQPVTIFDVNENARGAQSKTQSLTSVANAFKTNIERTEKLAKIMGIDMLPITLPKSVIEKKGATFFDKIFDFLDFNKEENIDSVLEMQVWVFKQLSSVLGHWMMEIEVEDAEPLKEGQQKENVVLPNIALTMREQIAMQIQTLKAVGMMVDMQIKTLIDLTGTKVLSAECAARLEDLQMYLDYETDEVSEDLKTQVTMPDLNADRKDAENLEKFLQPGNVKVTYDKWIVQKSQSMDEKLIQLLEMSSAIRALYFHNGG